ncbi:hypothetical protein [uncultured Treponema sp.]|uniref:hypothetical protein n=1 Tax=uncultured Treponema sp. TaxID=162155 RepID=UPI0025D0D094|nr:hypothetical protein [uncultured Treponema sp.]
MKRVIFFILTSFVFQTSILYGYNCMKEMKELLKSAECDLESYPAPWELLYPDSCKEIKKIINTSSDICIDVLVDKEISDLEKKIFISIFAYDANFESYMDLLSYSTHLYLNGEINFKVFEYMFVNPEIKHIMKKQYKNKKIRSIVKNCLKTELPREEIQFFKDLKKGNI